MPDISIQFYATPEELAAFVKQIVKEHGLYAVAMRFFPFGAICVCEGDMDDMLASSSPYRRWAFTLDHPSLPVENELDHGMKNANHLRLDIGRLLGDGLEQSWLTCQTDDKTSYGVWKSIAKHLKGMTFAGVTGFNRETGDSAEYRAHRYSMEAKHLEDHGVPMLPAVGSKGPIVRLGLSAGAKH